MALDTRKSQVIQQWDDGFVVRRMTQDQAQQVIKWFNALTTMSCDLEVALRICDEEADGFYVGELNGKMVASAVEMAVAADVRYIGCVYVDEQHRKSGFARRMITTARNVGDLHHGSSVIALDTHPYLQSMYEKFDYKTAYKSADYQGTVSSCIDLSRFGTDIRQVQMLCRDMYSAVLTLKEIFILCSVYCIVLCCIAS